MLEQKLTTLNIPRNIQDTISSIYSTCDHYGEWQLDQINEFANRLKNTHKKSVVFVAVDDVCLPTIRFISKQLQKLNYQTFAIYLIGHPPTDIYDNSICCHRSMNVLLSLIQKIPTRHPVYLQAHSAWAFLSIVMRAVNPKLKIYQELYDWVSSFVEEQDEESFAKDPLFDEKTLQLTRYSENWITHNTNGFLYKNVGPRFDKMLKASTSPHLKLFPCPPSDWMVDTKRFVQKSTWHITFAGQIKTASMSSEIWSDIDILPVIRTVTKNNIRMSIYPVRVADDERENQFEYRDYFNEQENNPNFTLERYMPIQSLIKDISKKFHYGTLLFRIKNDLKVSREHTEGAMASKLFTYISAGIPVLISKELKYMADIISSHKIGLVLSYEELNHLDDILNTVDYEELLKNVSLAQKAFCIDNQVDHVLKLMTPPVRKDLQLLQ